MTTTTLRSALQFIVDASVLDRIDLAVLYPGLAEELQAKRAELGNQGVIAVFTTVAMKALAEAPVEPTFAQVKNWVFNNFGDRGMALLAEAFPDPNAPAPVETPADPEE